MHRFRYAILGAAAAFALGTAGAAAMQLSGSEGANQDSHGDAVASAARTTCPDGPEGVHGQCVSAIASKESTEAPENEQDTDSSNVNACKAKDKTEDKAEHKTFAACVSGGTES